MAVLLYAVDADAYIVRCDVDARGGLGEVVLGPRDQARRFPDAGAALTYWKRPSTVHPVRSTDGKPNRPLTAYTVELVTVPDAED